MKASIGHIRDLPRTKLGVNVRKNFEPQYEILREKETIVAELKEAAQDAEQVYLAPDPDREGEAIAWHLSELLALPKNKLHRIEFNEITTEAVLAAMKAPRQIDKRLVDAQQARRVLDRLVGYKISPLLWRKVNGRSAGRVQSVAVRIICEREGEVEEFVPQEYWSIKADLAKAKSRQTFTAALVRYDGKRVIPATETPSAGSFIIDGEGAAADITSSIESQPFVVSSVSEKVSQKQPSPPFITSTLQREAAVQLGFAVKKTMQVAQGLYEGVELGTQGPAGLITYMRTDSTRIANQAAEEALNHIANRYGSQYAPDKPRVFARKAKNVQDAHEAIRPTSVERTPEIIKPYLNNDQFKLYKLIWERFLACQMAPAELLTKTIELTAGVGQFRSSATEVKFPGFTIVYNRPTNGDAATSGDDETTSSLPELAEGEEVKLKDIKQNQHFTQPPPRFNEASLVKTLEELGIGRPSTYATTVATIIDRKYVEKQGKMLSPTKLGRAVNGLLVEHFGDIVDVGFTAEMESKLDRIEDDEIEWHGMLKEFYQPFGETLKKARDSMDKVIILSEHKCPTCGESMAVRSSRFGQFLGCINYPACTTKIALTKEGNPVPPDRPSEESCKTCGSPMIIRYGRYGDYLVCSAEGCAEQRPIVKSTGVVCPAEDCGGEIVVKKSRRGKIFYGCSHYSKKKCTTAFWYPPLTDGGPNGSTKCPTCGSLLIYKTLKRGDQIACSSKECTFAQPCTGNEQHA